MSRTTIHNITEHFFAAAEKHPRNVAIIEKGRSICYSELAEEVRQTASYFGEKGIGVGDRVLVFVPMSIDLYRIVLALFSLGATAVFLDEWVSMGRLKQCCVLADCKGFIGTPKANVFSWFSKELRRIPIRLSLKDRATADENYLEVPSETSALITFTTGSTGIPKAADRSHSFLDAQFAILRLKISSQASDVDMPVLPIILFINLGIGATSVIADYNSRKPESLSPSRIIEQLSAHGVNRLTASPYVVKKIAEELIRTNSKLKDLKQVFTGGAPVFPTEARIYDEAFKEADVKVIYGSTEAEPISGICAKELCYRDTNADGGLAVGEVHPKTQLRIVSVDRELKYEIGQVDFDAEQVLAGEIGEILVAGDHVLKRYFRNPDAIRKNKVKVGEQLWHRTGDSGFIRDGHLYLTGRCNQLIKRDRQYISPFIIENQLQSIAGVTMGTMLEVDSELVVVLETERGETALIPYLDDLSFDRLSLMNKIPRDPRHNSKIDYAKLKTSLSSRT